MQREKRLGIECTHDEPERTLCKVRLLSALPGRQLGVSVAQWFGRRTSDLAVVGSIPGPRVIGHLGQLSLPSLLGS